jgi:carbonic anhydrase
LARIWKDKDLMPTFTMSFAGIVFTLVSVLACNSTREPEKKVSGKDSGAAKINTGSVRPIHWSYSEKNGPAGWASLSPVYAICGSGKSQSPINLSPDFSNEGKEWKIEYKTTKLQISHNQHVQELINNGHTIQVTPQKGSFISYAGKKYHLKQFHFHTPSEHTVEGKHYPMEIHLVHQADDESLAVIGVLVKEGNHNSNFDQLIKYLPNAPGEKKMHDSVSIDINANIPKDLFAYHYVGSLTTPPCSENVQWLVLRNPISMSTGQIAAFSSRLNNNNRPTQSLNARKTTIDHITTNR